MKLNKKGFIAIETIIIASLVLLSGGLGVSKFVSSGQNTTTKTNKQMLYSQWIFQFEAVEWTTCDASAKGKTWGHYLAGPYQFHRIAFLNGKVYATNKLPIDHTAPKPIENDLK